MNLYSKNLMYQLLIIQYQIIILSLMNVINIR